MASEILTWLFILALLPFAGLALIGVAGFLIDLAIVLLSRVNR